MVHRKLCAQLRYNMAQWLYSKVYLEGLLKAEMALQNCLPLLPGVYVSRSLCLT